MQIKKYKKQALTVLKGNWFKMITAVLTVIMIDLLLQMLLLAALPENSVWVQMGLSLIKYLIVFIFVDGLLLAAQKCIYKKPFTSLEGLFLFKKETYTHLVGINLVENFFNWLLLMAALIPFVSHFGLQKIFQVSTGYQVMEFGQYLGQQLTDGKQLIAAVFSFVILILNIIIAPLILGYFQILIYLKLDFPAIGLRQLVALSKVTLKGQWLTLWRLELSFVGWLVLALVFTAGMGVIVLAPYVLITTALFYNELKHQKIKII